MVDLITEIMKAHCYGCDDGENSAYCSEPCDSYEYTEEAVNDGLRMWLSAFDTSSATKCFEAVNLLKQRLGGEG